MWGRRTLNSTTASDILLYTIMILSAFSSIMFLFKILGYSEVLVFTQSILGAISAFVVFLLPSIFKLTVPISLFVASTMVSLRMSHDHEIESWMACGTSLWRFLKAPMLVGSALAILSLSISLFVEPFARREWLRFKWLIARKSVEAIVENKLREKTFVSQIFRSNNGDVSIYVDKMSSSKKEFKGFFLSVTPSEGKKSYTLIAKSGKLVKDSNLGVPDYSLILQNGSYHQPEIRDGHEELIVINFQELKLSLVGLLQQQFEPLPNSEGDMRSLYPLEYVAELKKIKSEVGWEKTTKKVRDHTFFYEQISVPLSCFLLSIVGFCLGLQDPRRKSGMAYLGIGVVIFLFYASVMLTQRLAIKGTFSPEMSLILPPVVLASIALVVIRWRLRHPPSTGFVEFMSIEKQDAFQLIKGLIK